MLVSVHVNTTRTAVFSEKGFSYLYILLTAFYACG